MYFFFFSINYVWYDAKFWLWEKNYVDNAVMFQLLSSGCTELRMFQLLIFPCQKRGINSNYLRDHKELGGERTRTAGLKAARGIFHMTSCEKLINPWGFGQGGSSCLESGGRWAIASASLVLQINILLLLLLLFSFSVLVKSVLSTSTSSLLFLPWFPPPSHWEGKVWEWLWCSTLLPEYNPQQSRCQSTEMSPQK